MTTQVMLEFRAREGCADKVCDWLRSVLPDTRGYRGCVSLHVVRDQEDPMQFVIVEQWDQRADYESYLAWRAERGDMEIFGAMMDGPPRIRFFDFAGL